MTAAIGVDVTVPVTRFGFGPFAFDALEQMIGAPLADPLAPLLVGPVVRRPSVAGPAVEVYPLALPPGEGASVPLGAMGEFGFANADGLVALMVPWAMASWVAQRAGAAVVRGPEATLSVAGSARVAEVWVRLRPGMRASVPLGALGEAGIDAR